MKAYTELKNDPIWEDERPWLVAGTGPSLDLWKPEMHAQFRVVGINKAALPTEADIAFFTDYGPAIYVFREATPKRALVSSVFYMDMYPRWTIREFIASFPEMQKLEDNGNFYAFATNRRPDDENFAGPPITFHITSGEAALAVLAELGEKMVYTIGIDCGHGHSNLVDTEDTWFDYRIQAPYLEKITERTGMHFEPLSAENL